MAGHTSAKANTRGSFGIQKFMYKHSQANPNGNEFWFELWGVQEIDSSRPGLLNSPKLDLL